MASYIIRRFAIFVASLFLASVAVFWVLAVLPGDPATRILGTQATPENVERLRHELGIDRPLTTQYADWVWGTVTGDLGTSYVTQDEITPQIRQRLKVTLPLAIAAMFLATAVAIPVGVYAASNHRQAGDTAVSILSQLGISIPAFWAGLLLTTYVAVKWGILPAGGFPGWGDSVVDSLRSLVLPAVSLALVQGAILTRYVRSAVLAVMREDYIRTARAKGLTRRSALWRHGLRNAAIPVITILGLQLAALIAGTVVIENVFVLPGLGRMLVQAIDRRDLLLVQSTTLVITAVILVVNLLVDLAYNVVDPRLRTR
ncbi:MAG: ABC transporter permease [Acidimicrobiales bacterium]